MRGLWWQWQCTDKLALAQVFDMKLYLQYFLLKKTGAIPFTVWCHQVAVVGSGFNRKELFQVGQLLVTLRQPFQKLLSRLAPLSQPNMRKLAWKAWGFRNPPSISLLPEMRFLRVSTICLSPISPVLFLRHQLLF